MPAESSAGTLYSGLPAIEHQRPVKMSRCFRNLLTAWLMLCVVPLCSAATNQAFSVRTWGVEDGLPQSAVLALTQTHDGYLWVGTLDGLARFDGVRFTTFREANTPGLTSSRVLKLFEDSRQNLWIGTETAGIFLVSDGRVLSLDIGRGRREGRLVSIAEDKSGVVWLYTAAGQLCRYDTNRVDVWNAGAGQPSNTRALITDQAGLLWVGTDHSLTAIGQVPPGRAEALPVVHEFQFPAIRKLDFLLASREGGYWRLANNRVQKWLGDRLQRDLGPYPWTNMAPVTAACEDLEGNLIVGTHGDGVFWFDKTGGFTHISSNDLPHKLVLSLATDREGCLWVGMNGEGLARLKRNQFQVLETSRGLTAQSTAPNPEGGIWVGYNQQRIDYWSGSQAHQYTNLPGNLDFVRAVFTDSRNQFWCGTLNSGLLRFADGAFKYTPGPSVLRRSVYSIFEDRAGRVWVGTDAGLARSDTQAPPDWEVFTAENGLSANVVRAIAEDAHGKLWIGTEAGGLNLFRDGSITNFGKAHGLPSENISALLPDKTGALWIGTSSGLAVRLADGKFVSLAGRLGPAADSVAYLLEDATGYLWIGSTAGLVRAKNHELQDLASEKIDSLSPRLYTTEDGLPSSECTQGSQPAACVTRDGRMWFPTTKGVAFAHPGQLKLNTNPPPVIIEAVLVDNDLQGANSLGASSPSTIQVPPGNHTLEIRYTSLNLAAPDRTRFKYRLQGHENGWTEVSSDRRFARYPRLPPGDYLFEVSACNEDGVWNPAFASLQVSVLPPFYRTWWFLSLTSLALLGLIVGSVHFVSTQKLQRQVAALQQQEALEKERARIARDLHDQLGANLTQVALLGEMAETDKEVPMEVEAHARQICQTARDTTRALDEIVWTVNPSNDTLDGLINYICKYAQEYLALAGLKYRLEVPSEMPNCPITPELRHNVFLVAKEAVNNIVKHSKAASAWLRLQIEPDRFTLEIEDDGRGISPEDHNKQRNGLRNMRRRIEDVHGHLEVTGAPCRGTILRLTVPFSGGSKAR